ncbi:biliverdin-producing heme oxygenase [Rhizobiales bacterium RZME27]|jgi:heme oxygenase|uniref:Biliverdin-producing heme oxygenase n=1 Tax=Endobacterium cereale TaxID=2663029 RepID=A0A6A8ADF9_9HYPH|nr:biliverdin-producing heme oxygenase [Endobacterium cereale]MEB2847583.1 biliverdin-producing heme oxygenase [Endobacterium cereale]MQY47958.1 biliverdin-producing heme oxygenase [Endobacterium cereale]
MLIELERPAESTRIQRLKALTTGTHDTLDKRIMRAEPFASRERYALFLAVQHHFHGDVAPLYASADLNAKLPGLADRCRLEALRQDIVDLGGTAETLASTTGPLSPAAALGWVYVAEGSNLGAAFLRKEAMKLDLSDDFGARHLAGHPEGRGLHWRNFVAAYNDLPLSEAEEIDAAEGAKAAFRRVHGLVEKIFG